MSKYLIVKPSFDKGNIGDEALICTIKNQLADKNIYIPENHTELNTINVDDFTALVYFGNDCVAYYTSCIPKTQIINFLKNNKKVYIINTSWGSGFKKDSINFLKKVCKNKNFKIFMRDIYSYKQIQEYITFENKPTLVADLAFLCDKVNTSKIPSLEEWINKDKRKIIGINNHNDFGEFNDKVKNELIKFMENNSDEYRFLFIPHDSRKNEYEDLKNLLKVTKNIDGYVCNYLNPQYEKYLTDKLFLVISGRMHLCILTIPNSVPTIAIAYNGVKAKGTFQHWDIEDLVMEPKNINNLQKKVDDIKLNYQKYVNKINNSRENVEKLSKKQVLI